MSRRPPTSPPLYSSAASDVYKRQELGQSILEFDAEKNSGDIQIPFFVGHGVDNLLHPIAESEDFYRTLPGEKKFYAIPGKHNDFMFDEHPVFLQLIEQLNQFFAALR